MNAARALLAFADLEDAANLMAPADREAQRGLVEQSRAECRAFRATIRLRSQFRCERCGAQQGQALYHFEDPAQKVADAPPGANWGQPAGRAVAISRAELHGMLAHGDRMPPALWELFEGVSTLP